MSAVFQARPSRDFVPAADLLSCARKKVGKESAPVPSPLRCAKGSPAMLEAQGRAELTSLRSVQTGGAKSVLEARFARALGSCASRLLQRGAPQQPTAKPTSRLAPAVRVAPFSTAEERKTRSPRAQHASSTDSRRLFEQSVAARVRRGASGLSTAGHPSRSEGRCGRGELFAYFLAVQKTEGFGEAKVGRPPGRNPGTTLAINKLQRETSE